MDKPRTFGVIWGSAVNTTSQFWVQFISIVMFLYWKRAGSPALICCISATGVMFVLLYWTALSGAPGTSGYFPSPKNDCAAGCRVFSPVARQKGITCARKSSIKITPDILLVLSNILHRNIQYKSMYLRDMLKQAFHHVSLIGIKVEIIYLLTLKKIKTIKFKSSTSFLKAEIG